MILVSLDTLRADHLDLYGYPRRTAPYLRRLAAESVVFDRAYSQSPKTAPSHMTMMTGLYPEVHGVKNLEVRPNVGLGAAIPTLASLLDASGYQTAAFTGGGHLTSALGFDRGFETFYEGYRIETTFGKAVEALERLAQSDDPFFLFVHTYQIHDPYLPPQRFQVFNAPDYSGPVVGDSERLIELSGAGWSRQHEVFWSRVRPESDEDLRRLEDLYDGSILYTDTMVGSLIDRLRDLDEYDNSLIVVLSDHGEEFREHGRFCHNSLYEEILHVPLVVRFPRAEGEAWRDRRIGTVARLVDLLPTLLDYLRVSAPGHLQGESLLPWLRADGPRRDRPVLAHWPLASPSDPHSLRVGRWKLIETGRDGGRQLFDLASDPRERVDLASVRPDEVARLLEMLTGARAQSRELSRRFGAGSAFEISAEQEQQLRALGYLR